MKQRFSALRARRRHASSVTDASGRGAHDADRLGGEVMTPVRPRTGVLEPRPCAGPTSIWVCVGNASPAQGPGMGRAGGTVLVRTVMREKISVDESCNRLDEAWRPRVIAALNGQEVKLIRVKGVFPWHRHDDADEFFLVWKGRFSVEYRDRRVDMKQGDCVLASSRRRAPHLCRRGRVRAVLRAGRHREHRESPGERVHRAGRCVDLRCRGVTPSVVRASCLRRDRPVRSCGPS